ncbi:myogenesis-regulating glycosidase-like isoform X2 [Toxorhynchites rutilus septentrionalis]|uniref:myogenesis-regulating glycosidase-like isoform X2 n=1 Tax=Toxorhynchites rutilus septentrionalis TaxID=329112 RepID=UPI002478A2AF|nr:myogenesis-regulating glycosidase-like isoform X2 [Toxorhynchites rutilus septentrionalis]
MALKVTRKCIFYTALAVIIGTAALAITLVLLLRDDEEIMKRYEFSNSDLVIQVQEQPDHRYILSLISDGIPIQRITFDHDFTDDSVLVSTDRGIRLEGNGQRIEITDIEDTDQFSFISITRKLRKGQIISDVVHTGDHVRGKEIQWYGGPEQMEQLYPVQKLRFEDYAYIPKELHSAAISERYWLNSAGVFLYVEKEVPLFIDQDEATLRLTAKKELPYYSYDEIFEFNYRIGVAKNAKEAHVKAVDKVLNQPVGIPDERMVRHPIWSTWVRYRRPISQQTVLDFASEIKERGFKNAQLDIDDFWESCYGSLVFDSISFPNVTELTEQLKEMGFRVTLWIHPFINKNCQPWYTEALSKGFLVKSHNESIGYNTKWWNSVENEASYINFNNPAAVEWFRLRLKELQEQGIDSFKFDAGEPSWAPADPDVEGSKVLSPTSLTTNYVRMCAELGPMIEIRTGWTTQDLPVFVRMIDLDTRWGMNNGLQSLIPTMLQMNLNGYPFVLPDMIGGNVYGDDILTKELFVRWLQANTFMPSMQFSKTPWDIDEESIELTRVFTQLHEDYSDYILQRMRITVTEGTPVNPPIWWLDPDDEEALKISDEYLLGEDILVAPVLTEFATTRDVYLPGGTWRDGNTNQYIALFHQKHVPNEVKYVTSRVVSIS